MSNFFVHESSFIDDNVIIGDKTKIWHFSHIQSGVKIGEKCILGQNVNVGNNVIIAAKSGVTKNIDNNAIVAGFPAIDIKIWKKNIINQYKKIR